MNGDDSEFLEAVRLALKFFPESRGFLSEHSGMYWDAFLGAMMTAEFYEDCSCDPLSLSVSQCSGIASKGGLEGSDDMIFQRLLEHTGITPSGRVVVVPDGIGRSEHSSEDCRPFVCHSGTVRHRLKEITCFESSRDTIFIFESGWAILVDHDDHVYWAKSLLKRQPGNSATK